MSALREYIDSAPVFSTHEHHRPFSEVTGLTLDALFNQSLVAPFTGVDCSDRGRFLDVYQSKSSFVWLEKAINDIFGTESLKEESWDCISDTIVEATADTSSHERFFREKCGFSRVLLDAYWDSGSNNDRPDLYSSAFRIDTFLVSCNSEFRDSAGTNTNAQVVYGECANIDDYLVMIDRVLREKKEHGCRALKSGCAHIRSLNYQPRKKSDASSIFGRPAGDVSKDDLNVFGDFVYDVICDFAAQHGLPFQNHVGLSVRLPGSRPMGLIPMIERHPQTTFVFLHAASPGWMSRQHLHITTRMSSSILPGYRWYRHLLQNDSWQH